ncbi:hypothetical protein KP509_20G082100 [Ceratopteris richardii]|nr:hypothetical protein KP509_20G082100 [Ceratopteris richardii]
MAVFVTTGEAIREVGVREVGEMSLEEQEQVMRFEDDMESAQRHLLAYDPYHHHWYGGKDKHWYGGKGKH